MEPVHHNPPGNAVLRGARNLCLALLALAGAGASCRNRSTAPACAVSPDTLDFGLVPLGLTADRKVVISNVGVDTLSGVLAAPCGAYSVVGGGAYSLGPGQATTLTVRFAPLASGRQDCAISTGLKSCTRILAFASSDTGLACTLSPPSLDFGEVLVGLGVERAITVTNHANVPLDIRLYRYCGDFLVSTSGASGVIAPGDSTQVAVRFQPQAAIVESCELSLGLPCRPIHLVGKGKARPVCPIDLAPGRYVDFGDVEIGQSVDHTLLVENRGPASASGRILPHCPGVSLLNASGQTDSAYVLAAGEAKFFTLRWQPSVAGTLNCSFQAGDSACPLVEVSGNATVPSSCLVTPNTLDFGTVPVGQSATRSFTVSNTSENGAILSGTVRINCGNYQVLGGTPYTLSPGQSAVVTIQFTPTSPGRQDCTLTTGLLICGSLSATGVGQSPP